jgi:hypothetical protein
MCSRVFGDTKVWGCPAKKGKASSEDESSSSSSKRRPALKTLELSNSMHPQYVSFQILLALNSSAYDGLSCHGLNFVADDDNEKPSEEETPLAPSYIRHMKVLIHSRKWLRLEFHRCLGVESLLWMPAETGINNDDGEDCSDFDVDVASSLHENPMPTKNSMQPTRAAATTEVDFLVLKFRKCSLLGLYDENRHGDFFVNLWNHWKVRKLSLSMDFTPEWTREFCRRKVSMLEGLEINPECTWHRRSQHTPVEETPSNEAFGAASNGSDDDNNNDNDNSERNNGINDGNIIEDIDCWELFCRELRINHPQLRSLEIRCKTRDEELAYLIDRAIASDAVDDGDSPTPTSVLPIEKVVFGKWCSCDEFSLIALSRVLTASSSAARRWKVLTMSRGVKLPSQAALDAGNVLPKRDDRLGLLRFCRALQHATALTHLELGDYILDETEMGAMFESLVLASGNIERLSLFACAANSQDVYGKVLCGDANRRESQQQPPNASSSSFSSCLTQNRLPSLRLLYLPKEASKALCEVLKSNTSIERINNHGRTKTHEYYLDLNRGGRHILTAMPESESESASACHRSDALSSSTSTSALSPALWPKVLERASSDLQCVLGVRKNRYCGGKNRKYDVLYCLLRNQILLES